MVTTMTTETLMADEKRKKVAGSGRKSGTKNLVAGESKQSMAQFFESLTASNYRWRTRVKKILDCERGVTEQDFHKWSLIALDRTLGTPGKHQEAGEQRIQLSFLTTHGYLPYDSRAPEAARLDARSAAMNSAKEQDLRMQALEAAKPDEVIIEVEKTADTEVPETLESVDPNAFGGGGSRR